MHFSGEMGPFSTAKPDEFCEDRFCEKCGAGKNCQRVTFSTKLSGEMVCAVCGKAVLFMNGQIVKPEQRTLKKKFSRKGAKFAKDGE